MGCCSSHGTVENLKNNKKTVIAKGTTIKSTKAENFKAKQKNTILSLDNISKITDFKKKYEFVSLIGSGGFGKVRLYKDKMVPDLKYAIKTMKKNYINLHNLESIVREVSILMQLDHPNIVKYFETFEDEKYIHIVMEFVPGESLFSVLWNNKRKISESDMNSIIKYLLKAVAFIHNNEIIHRDLKPENILFSIPGKWSSLKLIDFGLSIPSDTIENYRVGSPYYMSPEMIDGKYAKSSDIWSIGIILYLMSTGYFPFYGNSLEEVLSNIKMGKLKFDRLKNVNKELIDLVKSMLNLDPEKRPTANEVLSHPWFTSDLFDDQTDTNNKYIDINLIESLQSFKNNNPIAKEALFYLAKISSEEQVLKLKKAFLEIDKDNTGALEYDEILYTFEKLGIKKSDEELRDVWNGLDFHIDGKVNYHEFLAATISTFEFFKEEKIWSAFKYFDPENKGYITSDSMITALKKDSLTADEYGLKSVFERLDKKGKVNFEEFKAMILKSKTITPQV